MPLMGIKTASATWPGRDAFVGRTMGYGQRFGGYRRSRAWMSSRLIWLANTRPHASGSSGKRGGGHGIASATISTLKWNSARNALHVALRRLLLKQSLHHKPPRPRKILGLRKYYWAHEGIVIAYDTHIAGIISRDLFRTCLRTLRSYA